MRCALKRLMGSPAAALLVVRELWHARGDLFGDDRAGLVSVLPLSALLNADNNEVHLPRATAVTFAGHVPTARVPAATAIKWRGQVETRVRTLLIMVAGEGRGWKDTAGCADVQVPAAGDSLGEGHGREPDHLCAAGGDVECTRLPAEEDGSAATALRHKVDVLALTETRSQTQGESGGGRLRPMGVGANRAEGKALLVHTGGHISAEPEAVTEDVFVLTVRYRENNLIRVGVVYDTPHRPEREVLDGLQDIVQRHPGPMVLLGNFNKDALRRPAYQSRLRTWGYTAYPTGWTWTWRGAGAHAHERSMIDFILAMSDMKVAKVQVLGRIPVRTDHRMVPAEVHIKGT